MLRYLFALFFLIPLLEVWILVKVGRLVGGPVLIGSIIMTAAIGVYFLRSQGLSTLARAQQALSAGQLPAIELIEGALLLLAGAFLLTPGFATDAVGFTLLWPLARRYFAAWLIRQPQLQTAATEPDHLQEYRAGKRRGETIDGEYTRDE